VFAVTLFLYFQTQNQISNVPKPFLSTYILDMNNTQSMSFAWGDNIIPFDQVNKNTFPGSTISLTSGWPSGIPSVFTNPIATGQQSSVTTITNVSKSPLACTVSCMLSYAASNLTLGPTNLYVLAYKDGQAIQRLENMVVYNSSTAAAGKDTTS
jgi:hypothetical protein